MNSNRIATFGQLMALALLLASPAIAAAEPVGEMLPLSESGAAMLAMAGGSVEDEAAKIPSKETVGLPVFPGAFYTASMSGEGMLPSVIMASSEPIENVQAWYREQDGLTWNDMFGLFHVGEKYEMMATESVFLQDISEDPSVSTGGLAGFDMSGMKTQITISYQPRAAE